MTKNCSLKIVHKKGMHANVIGPLNSKIYRKTIDELINQTEICMSLSNIVIYIFKCGLALWLKTSSLSFNICENTFILRYCHFYLDFIQVYLQKTFCYNMLYAIFFSFFFFNFSVC